MEVMEQKLLDVGRTDETLGRQKPHSDFLSCVPVPCPVSLSCVPVLVSLSLVPPWPDFRAVCQDPGQGGVQREEEQVAVGQGRIQEASGRVQAIPKVGIALGRVGKLGFVA